MPTENECSNRATATEKVYAQAMITVKLGFLLKGLMPHFERQKKRAYALLKIGKGTIS